MKWSVQHLLAFREKGLQIDESVDVSSVKEMDHEIREIPLVQVKGNGFINSDSAAFQLEISGTMTLPCARTLNDVVYPFTVHATEVFQLDEWATFEEDEEVHELDGNMVDLLPYVKERILLEKPMRVFSEKTEGPAPEAGTDWELVTEESRKENKVDPRLKELEKFFDKK